MGGGEYPAFGDPHAMNIGSVIDGDHISHDLFVVKQQLKQHLVLDQGIGKEFVSADVESHPLDKGVGELIPAQVAVWVDHMVSVARLPESKVVDKVIQPKQAGIIMDNVGVNVVQVLVG